MIVLDWSKCLMDANIWFQDESAFGISLQSRFSWCQRCQRLHWYLSLQVFFNPTSCNANIFWIGETIEESTLMPDYILHLEQTLIPTGLLIYSPSVIKLMLLLLSWMKVPKLIQRRRHNFKLSWSSWEIHLWYYLLFELSRCSVSPLFNSASTIIIIVTKIVTTTFTLDVSIPINCLANPMQWLVKIENHCHSIASNAMGVSPKSIVNPSASMSIWQFLATIENHCIQVQWTSLQNHWPFHPPKILPTFRSTW